jgi:hypothetical protein
MRVLLQRRAPLDLLGQRAQTLLLAFGEDLCQGLLTPAALGQQQTQHIERSTQGHEGEPAQRIAAFQLGALQIQPVRLQQAEDLLIPVTEPYHFALFDHRQNVSFDDWFVHRPDLVTIAGSGGIFATRGSVTDTPAEQTRTARGQVLGAVTFVTAEDERRIGSPGRLVGGCAWKARRAAAVHSYSSFPCRKRKRISSEAEES